MIDRAQNPEDSSAISKFTIRLPDFLKNIVLESAESKKTSLNNEIVEILKNHLSSDNHNNSVEIADKKIQRYVEMVEDSTMNLVEALKTNEQLLKKTAPRWNEFIDNLNGMDNTFKGMTTATSEFFSGQQTYKIQLDSFKKSLVWEAGIFEKRLRKSFLILMIIGFVLMILSSALTVFLFFYLQ